MGGLVWRAGDYSILIKDYEYPKQYDSDNKELVIDKNHIFNLTITNLITGSEKQKEVPLLEGALIMPTLSLHGRILESYSPPEYYLQSDIFHNPYFFSKPNHHYHTRFSF